MKLLRYSLLALLPAGYLHAAVYTFDDAGYTVDTALPGVWVPSESSAADAPLSWTAPWSANSHGGGAGNKALAIGGFWDVPTASTYTVGTATPQSLSGHGAKVSFDMSIHDSSNDYPGRDQFGFGIYDTGGSSLLTLDFVPLVQSDVPEGGLPAQWLVSYTFAGGTTVETTVPMLEDFEYFVNVTFTGGVATLVFGSANASYTYSQALALAPGTSIGSVGAIWELGPEGSSSDDFGDNFMLIDNLVVAIPEPTSAVLLGLTSLVLFRRRRAH